MSCRAWPSCERGAANASSPDDAPETVRADGLAAGGRAVEADDGDLRGPALDDGTATRRRSRGVSVDPFSEYPRGTPRRGRDPPSTTALSPARLGPHHYEDAFGNAPANAAV